MSYQAKPRNYCYHFVIVEKQIAQLHKLYTSAHFVTNVVHLICNSSIFERAPLINDHSWYITYRTIQNNMSRYFTR